MQNRRKSRGRWCDHGAVRRWVSGGGARRGGGKFEEGGRGGESWGFISRVGLDMGACGGRMVGWWLGEFTAEALAESRGPDGTWGSGATGGG